MKSSVKKTIILSTLLVSVIAGITGTIVALRLLSKSNPIVSTIDKSTKSEISLLAPQSLNPSTTILNDSFVNDHKNDFIAIIKNDSNFKNLPPNTVDSNWNFSFDASTGIVVVSYTVDQYYDKNGDVVNHELTIKSEIYGFRKKTNNTYTVNIVSPAVIYINTNNTFSAQLFIDNASITNPNINYDFVWTTNLSSTITQNKTNQATINFNTSGNCKVQVDVYEKNTSIKVCSIEKSIQVVNKPSISYTATINVPQNDLFVGISYNFSLNITSSDNSPIPSSFYYEWIIQPTTTIVNNGTRNVDITFATASNYSLQVNVRKKSATGEIVASTTKTVNCIAPTYDLTITNSVINNEVGKNSVFVANFVPTNNSPMPSPIYYEWSISPSEVINNNGKASIDITWQNTGVHQLVVEVYKGNNNQGTLLATSKTLDIDIASSTPTNQKYGFNIDGIDPITNKEFTNDPASFDLAIANANNFIKNDLTEQNIKDALTLFINKYLKNVKYMKDNKLDYQILENNITLNSNKTISGNIKVKLIYNDALNSSYVAEVRESGDVEIHNFVFENSKIEPYINTITANFITFKITSKYLQKEIIYKNPSTTKTNSNIALLDEIIYLDDSNDLTLQINNSPLSLNYDKFFEKNYLYNNSTQDEKNAFKEVIITIARGGGKLKLFGNDPSRPTLQISSPVYGVELSKNYNLGASFAKNLSWSIASLYNFVSPLKPATIIGNMIYFNANPNIANIAKEYPGRVVDLNNNSSPLSFYLETITNNIYNFEREIKKVFINQYKDTITGDWNSFLNSMNDRQKAEKIYSWLMPLVSYGQKENWVSQIGGILGSKVICQGYASLFSYLANIFNLSSIIVTGIVQTGAMPGQSESSGKHAWNSVKIDNDWLWVDPTWDDSMVAGSSNYIIDYFLLTTDRFFTPSTHKSVDNWNDGNDLPIPVPNYS